MTNLEWTEPGRRVVCVSDFWRSKGADGPAMREVVTISETYINAGGLLCLRFVEHYGWLDEDAGVRHGYSPRCFRPIVSRTQQQDVEAIKALVREVETT